MPDRWHVVTPFKIASFKKFQDEASAARLWRKVFQRSQAGYIFCVREQHSDDWSLEEIKALVQRHLPPREYALFRIDHWGESEEHGELVTTDVHTRYEKVYADRIEPAVYSDDPYRRR